MENQNKIEKSVLKFQFIIYFLSCLILFVLLYVAPVIFDFKINGYNSLLNENYLLESFVQTPSEALNKLKENWTKYINPFSNYLVRFFIFTAIFGAIFEITKLSYNKLTSKNDD